MKNYRIYLLALLFVIASQSLFAIDGWWEKVQTKNAPSPRYAYTLINIAAGKVLLIGGKDTVKNNPEYSKKLNSEFWLFDYNSKDWIKLDITIPDYLYDSYAKHLPDEIFCKLRENKLLAYFQDKVTLSYDSATWVIDLEKLTWIKLTNTNYTYQNAQYKMTNLKDSIILQHSVQKTTDAVMGRFIFDERKMRWKLIESNCDTCYFRKIEGQMVNIADGKALYYGGHSPSWIVPEDEDQINYWLFDYSKLQWFRLTQRSYELYEDKKYKYIEGSSVVKLFDNVAFIANGVDRFATKEKLNDTTFLYDIKNKVLNKVMNIEGKQPSPRMSVSTELQRGKALMFGTAELSEKLTSTNLINDTWIFHADESLSVEGLENKTQQIRKIIVENKLLITQDLLDSRIIENAVLYNLVGSEVNGLELNANEIKFNCMKGTYLLKLTLSNKEIVDFIIIKN